MPYSGLKNEKMADFCGFAGVFASGGAVFRGFFGGGVGDFCDDG